MLVGIPFALAARGEDVSKDQASGVRAKARRPCLPVPDDETSRGMPGFLGNPARSRQTYAKPQIRFHEDESDDLALPLDMCRFVRLREPKCLGEDGL